MHDRLLPREGRRVCERHRASLGEGRLESLDDQRTFYKLGVVFPDRSDFQLAQMAPHAWSSLSEAVRCVYSIRSRSALVLVQESAETVATFQRYRLRPRPRRR
jgi:hypothetical protein